MRYLLILLWLPCLSFAQETEKEIQPGDTIFLNPCTNGQYTFIDFYKKTRWEDTLYLNLEGEAFYQSYFKQGDFDVSRLPCGLFTYAIIREIRQTEEAGEAPKTSILALPPVKGQLLWIEAESAFEKEEVYIK